MLVSTFSKLIQDIIISDEPAPLFITICLGANDACLSPSTHVPLAEFETHIRNFVRRVVKEKKLKDTKVILITPTPIECRNIYSTASTYSAHDIARFKTAISYETYLSKKEFAEKVMQIAKSYDRNHNVVGLNLWEKFVLGAWNQQGRVATSVIEIHENELPGSGLPGAPDFPKDYFTDGLHFGTLVRS